MNREQAIELKESQMWRLLCDEINISLTGLLQELKSASKDDVLYLQAKISAYEDIVSLPENVISREE